MCAEGTWQQDDVVYESYDNVMGENRIDDTHINHNMHALMYTHTDAADYTFICIHVIINAIFIYIYIYNTLTGKNMSWKSLKVH